MIEPLQTALLLIVQTLFSIFTFILMLRIVLVFVHADYFNPLVQFVTRFTDHLINPLRRILPNQRSFESASIVLLFITELIQFSLIGIISGHFPHIMGITVLALADMLKLLLKIFFYAILIQAILSWIQPYSPLNRALHQLTSPIMRPIQRIVPPIGGFDIAPLPALLILQVLMILLVAPLTQMGMEMGI